MSEGINLREKKEYELAYLVQNTEAESAVLDVATKHGGEIITHSPARFLALSYPVKKHTSGYFGVLKAKIAPEEVREISETLKLNPSVLRFMILVPARKKPEVERVKPTNLEKPRPTTPPPAANVLTNEALEEKLEEILK